MSKSILVIDTPENCYNCGIRRGYLCGAASGAFGIGKTIEDFKLHNPDRRPLKEVPCHKSINADLYYIGKMDSYNSGYNACIDKILKGVNGNG